jgi:hypothetical protein
MHRYRPPTWSQPVNLCLWASEEAMHFDKPIPFVDADGKPLEPDPRGMIAHDRPAVRIDPHSDGLAARELAEAREAEARYLGHEPIADLAAAWRKLAESAEPIRDCLMCPKCLARVEQIPWAEPRVDRFECTDKVRCRWSTSISRDVLVKPDPDKARADRARAARELPPLL